VDHVRHIVVMENALRLQRQLKIAVHALRTAVFVMPVAMDYAREQKIVTTVRLTVEYVQLNVATSFVSQLKPV
jgi:hypothetical protein